MNPIDWVLLVYILTQFILHLVRTKEKNFKVYHETIGVAFVSYLIIYISAHVILPTLTEVLSTLSISGLKLPRLLIEAAAVISPITADIISMRIIASEKQRDPKSYVHPVWTFLMQKMTYTFILFGIVLVFVFIFIGWSIVYD